MFQRPQDNGSSITCGTGFWEVVDGQEYTCVKISNKTDVSKFNGSNTVKKLSKVSGSFKAGNGSSVKNIAGFATVTLDGTIVNGSVKIDMTKNDSETYSFKNKKKKYYYGGYDYSDEYIYEEYIYTVTENKKYNTSTAGKFIAKNSRVASSIEGFQSVKLYDSNTGNISLGANTTHSEKSTWEKWYDEHPNFLGYIDRNRVNFSVYGYDDYNLFTGNLRSKSKKESVTGSLTATVSKDAKDNYTIGHISGYSNVTLNNKSQEKSLTVNGSIVGWTAAVSIRGIADTVFSTGYDNDNIFGTHYASSWSYSYKNNQSVTTYTGVLSTTAKYTSKGTAKLTGVTVNGSINGYKNVTLKNVNVNGTSVDAGMNGSYVNSYKNYMSGTSKLLSYTTIKHTITAASSFSAQASALNNTDINGYKTVRIVNSAVHNIVGVKSYTYTVQKKEYYFTADVIFEKVCTKKSAGSVTIKLDKNLNKEWNYSLGNIENYSQVTITGFVSKDENGKVYKYSVGDITGGNYQRKDKYDEDNYNGGISETLGSAKQWNFEEYKASGKVTLKNVVAKSVTNYLTVDLTDADLNGDVTGGNAYESWKFVPSANYRDPSEKIINEYVKSVAGTLNMSNAEIGGKVSGFKKINVKKGLNSLGTYNGLDFADTDAEMISGNYAKNKTNSVETITIAKKAVLAVKELNLQQDDKLVVNGDLVFWGKEGDAAVVPGVTKISGKGTVWANTSTANAVKSKFQDTKVVDLGNTSENFWGESAELADDETAKVFENNMGGWLGKGTEFEDDVDYIKFSEGKYEIRSQSGIVWNSSTLDISAVNAKFMNNAYEFTVTAETEVGIKLTQEGSAAYVICQLV